MLLQGCYTNKSLKQQQLFSKQQNAMRVHCQAAASQPAVSASLKSRTLIIATRSSQLAQTQSHQVAQLLASHGISSRLLPIRTRGDIPNNSPALSQSTTSSSLPVLRDLGPGAFTAELDAAVADGRADLAVHSLKDAPPVPPPHLVLAACLPREDPRDALITATGIHNIMGDVAPAFCSNSISETCLFTGQLPPGSVLGTASSRRKAQVLAINPGVKVVPMRGNVDSRLQQMKAGAADATLLAIAGLKRLNRADVGYTTLPTEEMLPAACQGIVGVMARSDDTEVCTFLRSHLSDPAALLEAIAERSTVLQLMESEHELKMPDKAVAVLAQCTRTNQQPDSWQLTVDAMVAELNGTGLLRVQDHVIDISLESTVGLNNAVAITEQLGHNLGQKLLALSTS